MILFDVDTPVILGKKERTQESSEDSKDTRIWEAKKKYYLNNNL